MGRWLPEWLRRIWFRCRPQAAIDGMAGLGDELGLAYVRIWLKMYADGGPVEFDDQKLKLLLEKRPQDVRRIVGKLVDIGKLTLVDGMLHNASVDDEIKWMATKWQRNEAPIPVHLSPDEPEMTLQRSGHNPEKAKENNRSRSKRSRGRLRTGAMTETEENKTLPAAESFIHSVEVSALPPRDAASTGSLGLGGRSPAEPVTQAEPTTAVHPWLVPPEPFVPPTAEQIAERQRKWEAVKATMDANAPFPAVERDRNGVPKSRLKQRIEEEANGHAERADDAGGDHGDQEPLPEPSGAQPALAAAAGLYRLVEAARAGEDE